MLRPPGALVELERGKGKTYVGTTTLDEPRTEYPGYVFLFLTVASPRITRKDITRQPRRERDQFSRPVIRSPCGLPAAYLLVPPIIVTGGYWSSELSRLDLSLLNPIKAVSEGLANVRPQPLDSRTSAKQAKAKTPTPDRP